MRVQRRPTAQPAAAAVAGAAALRRASSQAYVDGARRASSIDDTGDPALTLDMYEDGDHLARDARRRYTEILYNRLRPHFQ